MKNLFLLSIVAVFTLACSEKRTVEKEVRVIKDGSGKTTTTTTETSNGDTTSQPTIKTGEVKLVVKKTHIFSDPTKPDNFALDLSGNTLLKSSILFTITNPQGKLIYQDSMSASDLEASMVYEMKTPTATEKQREEFIKKRLNEFFSDKNFSTPAIAPNDIYDPSFGDEKAWNAIKKDPKSINFNYLVGKENGRRISYSKQLSKVMVVGYFGG